MTDFIAFPTKRAAPEPAGEASEEVKEPARQHLDGAKEKLDENNDVPAPWLSENTIRTRHPLVRLHNEILDFCNFISPSRHEVIQRENAMKLITKEATKIWADCEVKTYGSSMTGLSLPDSDVDIVIMLEKQKDSKALVRELSKQLKEDDAIVEQEEILGAKVPILKITEKPSNIPMDISFNAADGYKAIDPIKGLLKRYPPLKPLTLVIKAFLRERRLNETYTGGVGSFLLIVMIVAFLQFECKDRRTNLKEANLGELLIRFFRFYGSEFNHVTLGISIVGDGMFYRKQNPDPSLAVENPMDIDADIGKSARHYNDVVKSFQFASDLLRYTGASLGGILHAYWDRKVKKPGEDQLRWRLRLESLFL